MDRRFGSAFAIRLGLVLGLVVLGGGLTPLAAPSAEAQPAPSTAGVLSPSPLIPAGVTPAAQAQPTSDAASCRTEASGAGVCVSKATPSPNDASRIPALKRSFAHSRAASAADSVTPVTVPDWCLHNLNLPAHFFRTEQCEFAEIIVHQTQTNGGGTTTIVGTATVTYISYFYTNATLPLMNHLQHFLVTKTEGNVSKLKMSADGVCTGKCIVNNPGSIAPQPIVTGAEAEATAKYAPVDTAVGSIYQIGSYWQMLMFISPFEADTFKTTPVKVRCDNATGGSPRKAGCAIPAYPGVGIVDANKAPTISNLTRMAQASGLRGGTLAAPLHRTTDAAVIAKNRSISCKGAPVHTGFSCDEYPVASSKEGAASGGSLRVFGDYCGEATIKGTGPIGYTRCHVAVAEQNYQGGLLASTFRDQHVLNGDSFMLLSNFQ